MVEADRGSPVRSESQPPLRGSLLAAFRAAFATQATEATLRQEEDELRGQGSEPVELRPGVFAREQARLAEIEQWAWRRVRAMRAFYTHLTVFVGINFILFLVDSATPGPAWFYVPLLGWGLILSLHGLHAYDLLPWTTQGWEQRKVRELIVSRMRQEQGLRD